jgi:uncharacterized membrane protein YfcA
MAAQDRLRALILRSAGKAEGASLHDAWVAAPLIPAAIYGGFFGAGVSIIVIAVLGLVLHDNIVRLNALKQALSFAINLAAAIFFLFSGQVVWSAAAVMAVGALVGGAMGGRLAGRFKPATLRGLVIVIGLIVALVYLLK